MPQSSPKRNERSLAVDYVVRSDKLDEELPGLFEEINRRRPAGKAGGRGRSRGVTLACRACSSLCQPGLLNVLIPQTHGPQRAGLPPLELPAQPRQFNQAPACKDQRAADAAAESTTRYDFGGQQFVTQAGEQYCSTSSYYDTARHPRCHAQLNSFLAADLALLQGGGVRPTGGTNRGKPGGRQAAA